MADKRKGGPKFKTKLERTEVETKINKMLCLGIPQRRIAETVGVSQPQVHYVNVKLTKQLIEQQTNDRADFIAQQRAILGEVRYLAVKAYYKSMPDVEKTSEEWAPIIAKDAKGKTIVKPHSRNEAVRLLKRIHEKKGRLPANEYLLTIIRTCEAEAKLMGITNDTNIHLGDNVEGDKNVIDWNAVMEPATVDDPAQDAIEAKVVSDKPAKE